MFDMALCNGCGVIFKKISSTNGVTGNISLSQEYKF